MFDQKTNHVDVRRESRAAQRVYAAAVLGVDIGAMIQEQLQHGDRRRVGGGDEQRRALRVLRARVDVGAGGDQQPRLGEIGHGPHQRGRACRVRGINVGAAIEQQLHAIGAGEQHCVHERGRAIGVLRVGIHAALDQPLHVGGIRFLKRLKQRLGRRRFSCPQGRRERECEQTSS